MDGFKRIYSQTVGKKNHDKENKKQFICYLLITPPDFTVLGFLGGLGFGV
jgi:hypothetical protein